MKTLISREVCKVAKAMCRSVASPVSLEVERLIDSGSWDQLASLSVDPNNYTHPEVYFRDAACVSFLRKYEPLPTTVDRKKVAVENFFKAEENCFRTNQRLLPFVYNTYSVQDEAIFSFIRECRKEVLSLIGHAPPSNPEGRFGPGSTYGDRGGLTTIPDKMQSQPQLTSAAYAFLVPWIGTMWGRECARRDDSICFVRGDRFTTVPKDCTKDRGIAVAPSINLFYQLAYGRAMRQELKKRTAGRLDLEKSQIIHGQVAREASISGRFATIDLSQASDNQSRAYVRLLLPRRWYEPLDDLRSPTVEIQHDGRDKVVVLEKFSAMGNGYTFELETVLFLATCCAVLRKRGIIPLPGKNVFVYGDDIIVPTECALDVIAALRFFGFDTNKSKTFISGPFRESCGEDYFNGVDVRPYFLKKEVNEPQHYIAIANGIREIGFTNPSSFGRWPIFVRAWLCTLDFIPSHIKCCRGPKDLGDLVVHDEPSMWNTRTRSSKRYFRVYRPAVLKKIKWTVFDPEVQLASLVYGMDWNNGVVIPRDAVLGYKLGWVCLS